jgi:CBS domain-containing protein
MRAAEYFTNARDPKTLTVRQVMQDAVFSVSPDTKGITIAEIMTDRNFGAVPVVGEDRTLLGLVSEFDLLRIVEAGEDLRQVTAKEIMTTDLFTVTEGTPVVELIALLKEHHLIRTPVVRGQTLVGIASRRDALFGYVKATGTYSWPGKGGTR